MFIRHGKVSKGEKGFSTRNENRGMEANSIKKNM